MTVPVFLGFLALLNLIAAACSLIYWTVKDFRQSSRSAFWTGNAYMCVSVGSSLDGHHVFMFFTAAMAGISYWLWWYRGGGGRTKRRLKNARKFIAVRRTAPQA